MKNVLVLGAGQSTPFLIDDLLTKAESGGWFVTVGDRNLDLAGRRVARRPRGNAVQVDVTDVAMVTSLIKKADVVINLLAPMFQHQVALLCVEHGKHMISASYRDRRVRELQKDAQRRGILLLCEIGLDPGIDHMTAMSLIDDIRERGGQITGFVSYGSGVPAPDSLSNPLKYAVTWNPRNVVMAAESGAQYLIEGKIKLVPPWDVFQRSWVVEVEGVGTMEAYPNRDSLSYASIYGLDDAKTMIRGTLRYTGWSETFLQIVRLGLPNETLRVPRLAQRSWAELVEMFLPRGVTGADIVQRVANQLRISPTGAIMDKLRWLGLFSDEAVGVECETVAEAMIHLFQKKLRLGPTERDMVVLVHEVDVRFEDGRREQLVSTMTEYGVAGGHTAMSKTVGLPAAIAARLLLSDQLPLTGSHIPTHPAVYEPILAELKSSGIKVAHATRPLEG